MTMTNVKKGDTSVSIGGRTIQLEGPVLQSLEIDGLLLLRLKHFNLPSDDPKIGRNVIALDRDGNEVWRIRSFWWEVESLDGKMVPDPYSNFSLREDGTLIIYQGIGYRCELDPKTGELLTQEFTR